MKIRLLFIVFAFATIQILPVCAQQIRFNPVSFKPEKEFQYISDFTQDPLGYIWFAASGGGIYRYDGINFVSYLHSDSNTNSLNSDRIQPILADSSGFIWIGLFSKGLDRFDPVSNTFSHFRHDPKNSSSLASDSVTSLLIDHSGNFWIGTLNGLDMMDRKTGTFKHFVSKENDSQSLSFNHVRSIYEDHQGTIWIGTGYSFAWFNEKKSEGGLNRYNPVTNNFTRYMHDSTNPGSIETNKVKPLFEDSRGNFWVGTSGDGLQILDRKSGLFTHFHFDPRHPENLSRPYLTRLQEDYITFINEDASGKIWIGSEYSGMNVFDPATKTTSHYGGFYKPEISSNEIKDTISGFPDNTTYQGLFLKSGLVLISTYRPWFGNYFYSASSLTRTIPNFPVSLPGVNSLCASSDSILWIGTDSGLIRKNLNSQKEFIYLPDSKNKNSLSNKSTFAIKKDKDNMLWLATSGGLNKLDLKKNTFTVYRHDAKIKNSLNNDSVWTLFLDHNNDLWVGTSNGIDKMDKLTGQFTHFQLRPKGDASIYIDCITEDQENELWIGTDAGLYRLNTLSGRVETIRSVFCVRSIYIDTRNNLWISVDSSGGNIQNLCQYDKIRDQFSLFKDPETKKEISGVNNIMEDNNNNLWVSTGDAFLKINGERNSIRNYSQSFGVFKNFNVGFSNFKLENGLLFLCSDKGYYSFRPEDLKVNTESYLNITSFKLNGSEVIPADGGILNKPIWKTSEIRLSYNQNIFSFDFIGINYLNPGDVKYLFKLENYDTDWHKFGAGRTPYYFNVPPGNYIFRVKASNTDGNWIEINILVRISPPWWKTWWAYGLFIVLVGSCIWVLIYYRSQQLLRENRLLEVKVTHRTNQLNKSLQDLQSTQNQLIQSEKMASLGELTAGIAHEIQNPLNFINNFSDVNKELIDEMQGEMNKGNYEEAKMLSNDIKENEDKINHHGRRADSIVKGMLQHSRTNSGQTEPTDLNALADEYFRLCYHGLRAKDKTFNSAMHTDLDPAIGKVQMNPQEVGRVLLNLFNNAFYSVNEKKKEQPSGFDPTVSLVSVRRGNKVEITIRDNGNGVPDKIRDKIFQPFFTTKPTGSGTGLGLSLSYDIIKAHGGELKLESEEGKGAAFTIIFPAAI
jgi:signal transduction histidine kinase/ligand-binding sensor domain-containing protein